MTVLPNEVKQSRRIGPPGKAICMAYHGTDYQQTRE
jgi:hypothetical protein